jgi:hypothetical protein
MALNVDTQDLENYPGNTKRVTVDVASIVPAGYEGDEQIVLTVSTTAYSDNTSRTAIQNLYITESKSGWIKSSGFMGNKFALDGTHNEIRIKLDNTVSGTSGYDGSFGYYTVTLSHDDGAYINGEAVADDMETKIRDIPTSDDWEIADDGYILAYKNCSVEFSDGKFKIISGSIGNYYVGTNKSSVVVVSGTQNDCSNMLGFNLTLSSEDITNTTVRESLITTSYVPGETTLWIQTGTGVESGQVMLITDGTDIDYFMVDNIIADTQITVASGSITNNYTISEAKVQLLQIQDPDGEPTSHYTSMDSLGRYGIKHMVNQIDYSS